MSLFWKPRREINRVLVKAYDKLLSPYDALVQYRYDSNLPDYIAVTEGDARLTDKIAVFLIYQPTNFSKSIFQSCRHLLDLGYAVILVSSADIRHDNLEKLKTLCWKIIERPNYGYDFGGYRDGIRILQEQGLVPERLLIVNDSIWFPMYDENNLIKKMEDDNFGVNGLVFENEPGRDARHRHFQSFMTLVDRPVIESDAFRGYWQKYKVSSKKRLVLKRGEKGFTQALLAAGFGVDAPSTRLVLLEKLANQPNDFLVKSLTYAAYNNPDHLDAAFNLIDQFTDTADWRVKVLAHMHAAMGPSQPMGLYCYASVKLLDSAFLKKSSYPVEYDGMRWQYLRAIRNGDLPPPHPDILAEIESSKMNPQLTTDPSIPRPVSATKAG